jgi:hypothetical protein
VLDARVRDQAVGDRKVALVEQLLDPADDVL